MPVWHLLDAVLDAVAEGPTIDTECNPHSVVPAGPSVVLEDTQVSLQHLKKYKYIDRCSKEKVLAAIEASKEESERV